jgi:drug/metabolite transporter, DME family
MRKMTSILMIIIAAVLWGIIAFFVKALAEMGFTPMEIVSIRVSVAYILLLLIGLSYKRKELLVKKKDLPIFFGSGVVSIVFFNWCYFTTINQMNLSLAVILLYTAPAIVVLLSRVIFKEKLTKQKIIAVIGTLIGCIFITGVGSNNSSEFTIIGLLTGIGSGIGYALYSIFGKLALRKYSPFTITIFTFLFASIFLLPITTLWDKAYLLFQAKTLFWALGLGAIPTVIAYLLYTKGLEQVESGKAAIIATIEPLVATMIGLFLYNERLGFLQIIGIGFIFSSVIIVNLKIGKVSLTRLRRITTKV